MFSFSSYPLVLFNQVACVFGRQALKFLGLILVLGSILSCNEEEPIDAASNEVPLTTLLVDTSDVVTVLQDVFARSPLSAVAAFGTKEACTVELTVLGNIPVQQSFDIPQTVHEIPVLGLYSDTLNRVALKISAQDGRYALDTLSIQTAPIRDDFPEILMNTVLSDQMEPGMHLAGLHLAKNGTFNTQPIIFDNEGRIRWTIDLEYLGFISWPIQRFSNGNFIIGSESFILEFDMLGREVNRWEVPGYLFHHDMIEMSNGNVVAAVSKDNTFITNSNGQVETIEDHIVEYDLTAKTIVKEWDLRQALDVDRYDFVNGNGDWFHMNAIIFDDRDNSFILSGRHQGLVKIDYATGALKWILAPHVGWGQAGPDGTGAETTPFLLEAIGANGQVFADSIQQGKVIHPDFDWAWGQHAPLILPSGNIFLFDNGFDRIFGTAPEDYSRGVEYKIDETNLQVQQIWEYGTVLGPDFYSGFISDVDYLPQTGNRFIVSGRTVGGIGARSRMIEVTYPEGDVVFDVTLLHQDKNGNGLGAGQVDIVYRGERLFLYPDQISTQNILP